LCEVLSDKEFGRRNSFIALIADTADTGLEILTYQITESKKHGLR